METGVIAAITIIFIAGFIFARWWRMIRNYREVQKQFEVSAIQRAGRHSLLKVEIPIRLKIVFFIYRGIFKHEQLGTQKKLKMSLLKILLVHLSEIQLYHTCGLRLFKNSKGTRFETPKLIILKPIISNHEQKL